MEEENKKGNSSRVTKLLLYRQYSTYQVMLEAFPRNGLKANGCFNKIILYVMNWFKNRLGEDNIEKIQEIKFIKDEYPNPDNYKNFDVSRVPDINKLSAIDVKTAYIEEENGWVFELVEPDNGNEQKDIKGRTFITQIFVYLNEKNLVFGVKTICKEPVYNVKDADVYRPGFIKEIYGDPDIDLAEAGIPYEYRFSDKPIILNGKSSQECSAIYSGLIANPKRQLPIVFIPESLYEKDEETKQMLNGRTRSYLGFAHMVVCTRSNQKLFRNEMNNLELLEVSSEGQVILYRSNPGLGFVVEPVYFNPDEDDDTVDFEDMELEKAEREEDIGNESYPKDNNDTKDTYVENQEIYGSTIENINDKVCEIVNDYDNVEDKVRDERELEKLDLIVKKSDPLRRNYDFGEYSFVAKVWDPQKLMESIKKMVMTLNR